MDIDPRIDVEPEENCALCGEPLMDEHNIVLVEPGELRPSKKAKGFLYFMPDRLVEEDARTTLSLFHAHCMLSLFEHNLDWSNPNLCLRCRKLHEEYEPVYALQIGHIDEDTLVFVPSDKEQNRQFICVECAWEGFGEGDLEEGKALLEATG